MKNGDHSRDKAPRRADLEQVRLDAFGAGRGPELCEMND